MSETSSPPGALSAKEFMHHATEVGQWIWGTAQGAFNEKQTLAQIITDAAIGMIPVVSDVTGARDLLAVGLGMATHPEKREHPSEWVLLVILVFALIPVFGGVIKGVGRIALRVTESAAKDSASITKIAEDVVMFLNRIGHKNAEAWLKALEVTTHELEILAKFRVFCDLIIISIHKYGLRFRTVLPQSLIARMEQLSSGVEQIKILGDRMIPQALRDLHEKLSYLKKVIHSGGVPQPDKAATLFAQTGQKTVTYAEEARLVESGSAKKIVRAGKHPQNIASTHPTLRHKIDALYRHEPGFPDLLKYTDSTGQFFPAIAAASGPIKNEIIHGETLFRSFGPKRLTHGKVVGDSNPIGAYWGRRKPPATPEEFRGPYAVLDEFNGNGWLCLMHIPSHVRVPACTSVVSEQFSKKIAGQYLEGGGSQAVIEAFFEKEILEATSVLYKKGGGKEILPNGVVIEVQNTEWKGANGTIGYGENVIPGAAVIERLGITERQTKIASQAAQGSAKNVRNN